MRIASWNLNHRVGKTRFRPEAAGAACALGVDAIFFNEYFPQSRGPEFTDVLKKAGFPYQLMSPPPAERANQTFVAARVPVEFDSISLPTFDHQLPANVLSVRFPQEGIRVLALRVPAYGSGDRQLLTRSWEWLESTAAELLDTPAAIIGDLNVSSRAGTAVARRHFNRILEAGWALATPVDEPSYFSPRGGTSTLDHLLHTSALSVAEPRFVRAVGGHVLAGERGALSDHAALVAEIHARRG